MKTIKNTQSPHTPSPAQIDANRRNAQKSTGPRSPEGKAATSRNRLIHGLRANKHIVLDEDPADFEILLYDLIDRFSPVGEGEEKLVMRIAANQWRLDRAFPIEGGIYHESLRAVAAADDLEKPGLAMHQKNHAARPDAVPPPPPPPDSRDLLARAFAADGDKANHLAKLARYETSLEHSIERSLRQLKLFQAARLASSPNSGPSQDPGARRNPRRSGQAKDTQDDRPPWADAEGDSEEEIGAVIPPVQAAPPAATASNQADCHSNPISAGPSAPAVAQTPSPAASIHPQGVNRIDP